jgi:redox-sensitive bicupin YhaK (pirin superfamily)
MRKVLHQADERGASDLGWLKSRFSFSFADWYEPTRMGFGALRVINDDTIAPLGRFGMHPHADYEIITIPLTGSVTHEDSMGNRGEVGAGEVQAMSAGTGIVHSEFNASVAEPLELFQIWIAPNVRGAKPRYSQKRFDSAGRTGRWQMLVAEDGVPDTLPTYQDARILRADLETGTSLAYEIAHEGNGAYVLVIDGEVDVAGEHLGRRDALGISETREFALTATAPASVLLFEVPMS